jgi:ribosomal protein S18 acetylase RimI-like enzyme
VLPTGRGDRTGQAEVAATGATSTPHQLTGPPGRAVRFVLSTLLMLSADEVRLDNPVYAALTGAHSHFAQIRGQALRYPADVAPFFALPSEPSAQDWVDAGHLVPPGTYAAVLHADGGKPDQWKAVREFEVLQMVEDRVGGIDDPEAISLGPADVPEMLELVRETDPGPFLKRTIELGRYIGIRRRGVLIAMAGERIHFDGWREISAVCTAPTHRGHGLGSRLVSAISNGIQRRSERAFLHVLATNTDAIGLYEQLGFCIRTSRTISLMTREAVSPRT